MRRTIFIAAALLLTATAASAAPILFEAYQENIVSIPVDNRDTFTVAEIEFSVDTACYVHISAGGLAAKTKLWFDIDGENLPVFIRYTWTNYPQGYSLPYSYLLDSGNHTLSIEAIRVGAYDDPGLCDSSYLQALIFLPDAGGAIAEGPAGDVDATGEMTSVISCGPYVNVTGATELVDGTGRVIENAIEKDRVSINNLSQGTYFARKEGKTLVKIVKVD